MIEIKQQPYFTCDRCDSSEKHTLGHLTAGQNAGPWRCDCGAVFHIDARADGNFDVISEPLCNQSSRPVLVLLKMRPAQEVYILVRGLISGTPEDAIEEEGHKQYYYEQHTCPTNFLGVEALRVDGDYDKHGCFEYVGTGSWNEHADSFHMEEILERVKGEQDHDR